MGFFFFVLPEKAVCYALQQFEHYYCGGYIDDEVHTALAPSLQGIQHGVAHPREGAGLSGGLT